MPPITSQVWPLVIIGKGSTAAYYVCTVDVSLYRHVLAIGDDDPWAGGRGHHGDATDPTRALNHPLYLIEHFKKTVPGFSETMVDRVAWAKMNKAVLDECNVQVHNGKVKKVSESPFPSTLAGDDQGPTGYKIDLEDGTAVYAYKVVMAAGAGSHRVPPELKDWPQKYPKQIMNLDEFAKLGPGDLTPSTRVIVYGPNAAIDAVQKALHYQCRLAWLVDKPIKSLPILATQPTVRAAVDKDPSWIYKYSKCEIQKYFGNRIWVNVTTDKGATVLEGDYFVFGLGQSGEPIRAIDGAIKEKMQPILDTNQYLGGGPTTILGYEAEGTGLKKGFEVVGAMTAQMGRERLKILSGQIERMRSIEWLFQAITTAGFPVVPFLLKSPDFLAGQPRAALTRQLKTEADSVAGKNRSRDGLPAVLDGLVGLLLAYHAAKNYATLINQAASHQPKGTVADGGQLTTIKSAMAAKHTTVPQYLPGQKFTTPGALPKDDPNRNKWVDVQATPGDVNFSTDNATVLQIGLCQMYPLIPDDELNTWIEKLMVKRRASGKGFDPAAVLQLHQELGQMNTKTLSEIRKL
ncbi:MAG: hypothetical protein ACRD26_01420 [Vicinamibacterales bacterium]